MNSISLNTAVLAMSHTISEFNPTTSGVILRDFKLNSSTTSISDINYTLISELRNKIVFKNPEVEKYIYDHQGIVDFFSQSLQTIAENGYFFSAELDLINDGVRDKLLFIYRPFKPTINTNITESQEDSLNQNATYRNIIRHLLGYPVSIRKSVVIDEQSL
jgi:hypothetical protein